MSLCRKCRFCRWIDIEGNVGCEVLYGGKEKSYCRKFAPREE